MLNKVKRSLYKIKNTKEIEAIINEAETQKAELLLEVGNLVYEKIRCGNLIDEVYEDLASKVFELDKIIYSNRLKIEENLDINGKNICKCGYIFNIDDKFCAECGCKIQVEEAIIKEVVICIHCNCELDSGSSYCICCGIPII